MRTGKMAEAEPGPAGTEELRLEAEGAEELRRLRQVHEGLQGRFPCSRSWASPGIAGGRKSWKRFGAPLASVLVCMSPSISSNSEPTH